MGQLCIYLPPFAGDYSGACSALFDLDCMTAINDAACCTSHYVFCDEPRWSGQVRPVFSTALRNIDAVLGNDDKIVSDICRAAQHIDTEITAVIGTPIPAIIGMDTEGIAREVEFRTGRPCFGFNTTGFSSYDQGIQQAGKALIDRFARPAEPVKGRVNIVGMTPLDFGVNGNDTDLSALLEQAGWQLGCRFFMGLTVSQLRTCASAEVNLAVSSAGLSLAKQLQRCFGTPYAAGFPMGKAHARMWLDSLGGNPACPAPVKALGKRLLIVSDQVLGSSLRQALTLAGAPCAMDVASFFGWDTQLAWPEDTKLQDEAHCLKLLESGRYFALAGDPMLLDVPAAKGLRLLEVVHPAVSGKLDWEKGPAFLKDGFEERLEDMVRLLSQDRV